MKTHSGIKSNKCSQCDFATVQTSSLKRHLKMHSGEKLNKCNQCDFAFSQAGNFRAHLKTHIGEKSNKCNQCDYVSSRADSLRAHLKTHSGKSQTNAANVTLPLLLHVICGHISKRTSKSKKCNPSDIASSVAVILKRHLNKELYCIRIFDANIYFLIIFYIFKTI